MNELEKLYQLQQLDTESAALNQEREELPAKLGLQELEDALARIEEEQAALEAEQENIRQAQKKQETELATLSAKVQGEEGKLYGGTVANPKELRGLQAEVRMLSKRKDEMETVLLEKMESLEELAPSAAAAASDHEAKSGELEEAERRLVEEQERIGRRLDALREQKEQLRGELDPAWLDSYDTLLKQKHNLAVAKVVEGVCQGCRMELPAQEHDRFLHSEGLHRCPTCGRILVK